jgi:hypothetical protein
MGSNAVGDTWWKVKLVTFWRHSLVNEQLLAGSVHLPQHRRRVLTRCLLSRDNSTEARPEWFQCIRY